LQISAKRGGTSLCITQVCSDILVGAGMYECGPDVQGHFVITASRGGMTGTGEVDVSGDACHVHPAMLTIKLQ
jgi:hypothetical protein